MTQSAKVQEPSMEEILASIRRIIADEEPGKPAQPTDPAATMPPQLATVVSEPVPPPPESTLPPATPAAANSQDDINAMLTTLDSAEPAPPPMDVLNLTEEMKAPAPVVEPKPGAVFRTIDAPSDVEFTDRSFNAPAEPMLRMVEEEREPAPQAAALDRGLMSRSTMAAVDSAFNSLATTVLGQNARTLEDLVKEMLRPLLKSWLDENLPGLVDRIVRAEIERVSRGRP
jgi:cell pole-organizing protein PopZ